MSPTTEDFSNALGEILTKAEELGLVAVEVKSGNLHRTVGGYPGNDHRMPACCDAMRKEMTYKDRIVAEPSKGKGASLVIRYDLPR
jgi:hypothetical protein